MHHIGCLGFLLLLAVSGMAFELRVPCKHPCKVHISEVSAVHATPLPESLRGSLEKFGLKKESTDLILGAVEKLRTISQQPDLIETRTKAIDQAILGLIDGLLKVESSGPRKRCKGHRCRN